MPLARNRKGRLGQIPLTSVRDRGNPFPKVRTKCPPDTKHTMKTTILSTTIAIPLAFALASCGEKPAATEAIEPTEESVATGAEKVAEGVEEMAEGAANDAVEAAQDTAADATNAVEDAVEGAQEAAADAASAVEEAASDAAEAITEEPAPAE